MKNRLWSALFLSAALCLSLAACAPAPDSGSSTDSTDSSTTSSQGTDTNSSSTTIRLTSGHYTAGIDFPAGTYDLEAIAWSGNVSSSNGSINLAMGTVEHNTDGQNQYRQTAEQIDLPAGTVLSLRGGVNLRMTCDNADPSPLQPRNQTITEEITLEAGQYTAGTDFPAGIYDFTALDGVGNVESSNMNGNGISAVMGTTWRISEGFGYCDPSYDNVELPEGTTLNVSGVKLLLQPSA